MIDYHSSFSYLQAGTEGGMGSVEYPGEKIVHRMISIGAPFRGTPQNQAAAVVANLVP